ncbi:MAG: glycosyltransferase family 2 protein [Acidimicrobiia bacterium]
MNPAERTTFPRVRVVVVNFDGGDMTLRCLDSLRALDWPADKLEIVLVDNASVDGLIWILRRDYPEVRVIESDENLGFAGGCNLAMGDLADVDYLALLNNDAIADRNWLRPLVDAMEADPSLGAVNSKIVFAEKAVTVSLSCGTFRLGGHDERDLGVRISGVAVADGDAWADVWSDVVFNEGVYGEEAGDRLERRFRWTRGEAQIHFPPGTVADGASKVRVRLGSDRPVKVNVSTSIDEQVVELGEWPEWVELSVAGPAVDVINNVGSEVTVRGYGHDRGFLLADTGQYDEPAEVFAWCGAAVLLRREYLEQCGSFDGQFFLYYEDTDLSWRGRHHGWRYLYVPQSVVRHLHSASTIAGSGLFRYYVDRNRLLMLARNAPTRMLLGSLKRYLEEVWADIRRHPGALFRADRPTGPFVKQRLRSFRSFVVLVPARLVDRRRVRRKSKLGDDELRTWLVHQ